MARGLLQLHCGDNAFGGPPCHGRPFGLVQLPQLVRRIERIKLLNVKPNGTSRDDEGADPIGIFLSQPPYHAEENSPEQGEAGSRDDAPRVGFGKSLRRFLFEKKPSQYSSISPRAPNGTRTRIFPFNWSGRGR